MQVRRDLEHVKDGSRGYSRKEKILARISPEDEGEKRMRERRSRTSLAPKQKI